MNDKTTTTAVATNGQPQAEIEKQQALANTESKAPAAKAPTPKSPPKAPAPKAPAKPAAKPAAAKPAAAKKPEPEIVTSLINLRFGLMVTLDMTGQEIFSEQNAKLKAELSHFADAAGNTHNLYQPFKAVTSKTKQKNPNAARGLLRNALGPIYNIAAELEASRTSFVGEAGSIVKVLNNVAEGLRTRVANSIGIAPDTVLIDGTPIEPGQPNGLTLRMSDLLTIEAWANTSEPVMNVAAGEGDEAAVTSQVFVNLRIAPANLFKAEELDNGVQAVQNYMTASVEKFAAETGVTMPVLLGINLNVEALTDRSYIELLAYTNSQDWDLYSRKDLSEAADTGEMDWMPAGAEAAQKKLLGNSDMLIVTLLGSEEDSDDSESENEAE